MQEAKNKITQGVKDYIKLFPGEYQDVIKDIKKKKAVTNKFAELKGTDVVQRLLFEIPETLFTIINTRLTDEEKKWFESVEAGRWFAQSFRQFTVAEKL